MKMRLQDEGLEIIQELSLVIVAFKSLSLRDRSSRAVDAYELIPEAVPTWWSTALD